MNRRQFIASVGGLATVGSGVISSGAFSTVSAERNVSINVETDNNAYLTLIGVSADFTGGNGDAGVEGFKFNNDVSPADGGTFDETGEGVGANSIYEFTDLLEVQNRGTDPIVIFGRHTGDKLDSLELIGGENDKQNPLTRSHPSDTIESPGGSIRVGLQMEIGDISPQEVETEISIVGVSENSEVYPDVFPE